MIAPTKAFYRPGETATIPVPGPFRATIWHLRQRVATLEGQDIVHWLPPASPRRGYRVRLETSHGEHWTAFDVLTHWTEAPRYGFLFDFSPTRQDVNLNWLLGHHINALQFYDWQYRHDILLPPEIEYTDPLGRLLSLNTVCRLIDAAHTHSIAAMPYSAIYAASPVFAAAHPTWGLYDAQGNLHDFANGFLKIMNPASPWCKHFVRQCQTVLEKLPFDGIHVDQYGEPRSGFDAHGQAVDLPAGIVRTLQNLCSSLPEEQTVVFNLVHNWPLEAIAGIGLRFLYSELWPPDETLGDLARVATLNWQASGHSPVIAVYVNPHYTTTVKLVQSVIAACGGYHLAHGETGLYLCDPYFPKAQQPAPALAGHLKCIADFGVAYMELLALAWPVAVTVQTDPTVWVIGRRTDNILVLNFINADPSARWTSDIAALPALRDVNICLSLPDRGGKIDSIWSVSPDQEAPAQHLNFVVNEDTLSFNIPEIAIWTLVAIELKSTI